ncbi:MAG: GNAT family N-acetyltransferase [Candidatus Bathyarchaeia archaeon]
MTRPVNYQSPLSLEGWLEFNQYKWGVKPLRVRLTEGEKELPAIEAVLYLNERGRITQPPLNPYLPVAFHPTPTDKIPRLYRQWVSLSKLLAEEFVKRGIKGSVAFAPEVIDVRQWQWHGFLAEVRYTFYLDLPIDLDLIDHSERTRIRKAEKAGFSCEIADKNIFPEVIACLNETEARQRFTYQLCAKDLEIALDLLGETSFRVYVCKSSTGEVASTRIVINVAGLRAIDWVAGTKRKFLSSGATQLLIWHMLTDLARQGTTEFDFAGANLPTVSAAKADWGGRLVPFYVIRPLNIRTLVAMGVRMLNNLRRRKGE